MGHPTIYPTGVTLYNPEKAWNGYTVMPVKGQGAMLIDMNGQEIKLWKGVHGFPNKIFPGGYLLGSRGVRNPKYGLQDQVDLIQVDWDGNVVWEFNQAEFIEDPGEKPQWMARQHHDFQREGSTTGYYAPGHEPQSMSGNTLVLCHRDVHCEYISDKPLLDDVVYEVNWDGEIIWEWQASDHVQEMGFSEAARNAMARNPNYRGGSLIDSAPGLGDWMHINSMSTLGPNKWYDAGDERFHPDNIIFDSRESNILLIVEPKSGKVVWKAGPDYAKGDDAKIGQIVGPHNTHMIPKGLPGEGNILVFDNGGTMPGNKYIDQNHAYSRVVEFNPVTKRKVWEYSGPEVGVSDNLADNVFFSAFISDAQRLPNGNTLINEGSCSRIFEVTPDKEIVWDYVNPYNANDKGAFIGGYTYRSYAVPYEFFPQLQKPVETAVVPPKHGAIVMPDVNGKLPNIQPVLDKRSPVQFGELAPVATSAWKKAAK